MSWRAFQGMENILNKSFGEPCVYTPSGGVPTSILADFRSSGLVVLLDGNDRVETVMQIAYVRNVDVVGIQQGDSLFFVNRNLNTTVREILDDDLNMTKLILQ